MPRWIVVGMLVALLGAPLGGGCAGPGDDPLVAVGVEHGCGLWDGALQCWGSNDHGQLGVDLATLSPIGVAAGGGTTCALDRDGAVWCFGQNHRGQLGDGSFDDSATPRRVEGLAPAVGVTVGFAHACAWTADGAVCCWGWNGSGQSEPGAGPADVLAPACRDLDARRVVAGFDTTCVIDRRDHLACFGGYEVSADAVHDVAVGADHVCALSADAVTCHGVEPGGAGEPLTRPRVIPFSGGALAAGAIDHLCVTDAAGALFCMGKNDHGQLGDGSFALRPAPSAVRGLPSPVTSVGVGDRHTCAAAAGRVWCWGWNDRGQLGDDGGVHSLDPQPVDRGVQED
ncbi:MAG: hypothetical protein H6719_28305 [Sandaracinaceae bacterium]|nr:hypothetical protein [Sandaracinaceae bacterium]